MQQWGQGALPPTPSPAFLQSKKSKKITYSHKLSTDFFLKVKQNLFNTLLGFTFQGYSLALLNDKYEAFYTFNSKN